MQAPSLSSFTPTEALPENSPPNADACSFSSRLPCTIRQFPKKLTPGHLFARLPSKGNNPLRGFFTENRKTYTRNVFDCGNTEASTSCCATQAAEALYRRTIPSTVRYTSLRQGPVFGGHHVESSVLRLPHHLTVTWACMYPCIISRRTPDSVSIGGYLIYGTVPTYNTVPLYTTLPNTVEKFSIRLHPAARLATFCRLDRGQGSPGAGSVIGTAPI